MMAKTSILGQIAIGIIIGTASTLIITKVLETKKEPLKDDFVIISGLVDGLYGLSPPDFGAIYFHNQETEQTFSAYVHSEGNYSIVVPKGNYTVSFFSDTMYEVINVGPINEDEFNLGFTLT